ncbi:hypothetical protein Tco_0794423 [Tanacetum coccineum]
MKARQYNKPTVTEVAALITNNFGDDVPTRDIIMDKKDSGLKRISELHLLFPYGEDGFHEKILYHTNEGSRKTNRGYNAVTRRPPIPEILGGRVHSRRRAKTKNGIVEIIKILLLQSYIYLGANRGLQWEDTKRRRARGKELVLAGTFPSTLTQIDDIILAEIPSQLEDPEGYKVVTEFMLHGPCGKDAKHAPCNIEEKCSKHFPKSFNEETIIDADGYPIYCRRDNKSSATKGKFKYDNKYVVLHNRYLLLKYQAHINVEWCNQSKAIKYLFKYLNKGPDRATIVIEENVKTKSHIQTKTVTEIDEIKSYLNCRYLAPREANHLPALLQRDRINVTMFTDWFELNKRDPAARTLTYAEIRKHYVWHEKLKLWKQRKQQKCIGGIVYSSPTSGERYYLRMLLNVTTKVVERKLGSYV